MKNQKFCKSFIEKYNHPTRMLNENNDKQNYLNICIIIYIISNAIESFVLFLKMYCMYLYFACNRISFQYVCVGEYMIIHHIQYIQCCRVPI